MTADDQNEAKTAAEMVTKLQGFFESREKALKERESALERRLKLFEEQFPQGGQDSDVLHLNVGGLTSIAVLRRTLTHFANSMLASRFSGRWDESLEKDKNRNFFVDQDPKVFMQLLNYLRLCDQNKRNNTKIEPPSPSFEFCFMLEYYDLMLSVYPQEWRPIWTTNNDPSTIIQQRSDDDCVTIYTGTAKSLFALEVRGTKPINATSFTVTFDRGSIGQVGWAYEFYNGSSFGTSANEFVLDLEQRAFISDGQPMIIQGKSEVQVSPRENPVTVVCTYDRLTGTYSIRVEGDDPMLVATTRSVNKMTPGICFVGQCKISNLNYAY